MAFFPYENYRFTTQLSPDEILKRLNEHVEIQKKGSWFIGPSASKPYSGFVDAGGFTIRRNISYRNSFLPTTKGVLEREFSRTRIHVVMRMHTFVVVFMFVWLGLALFGGISVFVASIFTPTFNPVAFIALLIPAAGYLLVTIPFKIESRKTKTFLSEVLLEERLDRLCD
jgi:hypothetical protein